jgi:hypothetical protein
MKTRFRIIAAAVIILSIVLTVFLQQTGIVSADDITVTIEGPVSPTNVDPIELTITFSMEVTGFEEEDIVVENGTVENLDDSTAAEYFVEIAPISDGEVTVDIPAGAVDEVNQAAETYSVVYDSTAPTVVITSTAHDPTGNPLIPLTLTFSEPVEGLTITEVEDAITNATIVSYVAGAEVIDLVVEADGFGDVSIELPGAVATDEAGNPNEASEVFTIEYIDRPWVTINQASEQEDPTHVSPIIFDVVFSEAVTGFEVEDVDLSESTAAGELIAVVEGEDDRYTVSVSGMTGPGIVKASILEAAAEDLDENESLASTSTDNEVTYEGPVPTVSAIERVEASPTKAETVNFYVTFSEAVFEVGLADFELTTTGDISGASLLSVVGEGDQRFVTVSTGSGGGTLRLDIKADAEIIDSDGFSLLDLPYTDGEVYEVRIQTFSDVDSEDMFWIWIERLYDAGITAGCQEDPPLYCPDQAVTRAQMAIFLERGMRGSAYEPEAATGEVFGDVADDDFAADWIELLAADGITAGCQLDPPLYCPSQAVTRAQMAIFLLRAKYGDEHTPPDVGLTTGFDDVEPDDFAAAWIKELAGEGITAGCGGGNYCPDQPVTRAQMAVFLVKTFELP